MGRATTELGGGTGLDRLPSHIIEKKRDMELDGAIQSTTGREALGTSAIPLQF
jgi:hypothetical protein